MSASDQIGDLVRKASVLYEETVTTRIRFEALDKEVHRMLDAVHRLLDKYEQRNSELERRVTLLEAQIKAAEKLEQRNGELERRVTLLEAQVKTVYQSALQESMRGGLRTIVREILADEFPQRTTATEHTDGNPQLPRVTGGSTEDT